MAIASLTLLTCYTDPLRFIDTLLASWSAASGFCSFGLGLRECPLHLQHDGDVLLGCLRHVGDNCYFLARRRSLSSCRSPFASGRRLATCGFAFPCRRRCFLASAE